MAVIALNKIIVMFFIVIVGIICYKVKIITKETGNSLSNIVLMIVNPLVIFNSYQRDFDMELFKGLIAALFITVIAFIISIVISIILFRKSDKHDFSIERISCIYSNCGFIGIPLISALIGDIGVFYLAAYLSVFNILLWTQGVMTVKGKFELGEMKKALKSPTVIATVIGVIFFCTGIRIPSVLFEASEHIASMNTPLAMMVAGATMAQSSIKTMLANTRIYYTSFVKLILIPIVTIFAMLIFRGIDFNIIMTVIIAQTCPSGASSTLLAIKYGKNSNYASEIFAVTTVLSVVSIPILVWLANVVQTCC